MGPYAEALSAGLPGRSCPTELPVAVADVGLVIAAVGGAAVVGDVAPAASPAYLGGARRGPGWIGDTGVGVRALPVPDPLPDIVDHVVEAPGVGTFAGHQMAAGT